MHRPLRDVLRAGYVQPTDAAGAFGVKSIPFLEPTTEGFNLFNAKDDRTIRKESFKRVRGNIPDGAHFPLYKVAEHNEFQNQIRGKLPEDFSPDDMTWFHGWIEKQQRMMLVQLGAWPDQIEKYNRLSLCKVKGIPFGGAFSPYEIDEPMSVLTRDPEGKWNQWGKDHDLKMKVWFEVWNILNSSASGTHAFVFDTQ